MILSTLKQAERYVGLHPRFARAFEYLMSTDLKSLPPGKHAVEGEEIFVIVEACKGRTRGEAKLECHRRYIDIQLVLEGVDEMGWKPLAECIDQATDFNVERDIQFFNDTPSTWVTTQAGSFCIFFPDDAHAPLVSDGMIHKAIMKIAV